MLSGDSPEITSNPVYYVGAKEHTWRDLPTLKGNCSWPSSQLKRQYSRTLKRATFFTEREKPCIKAQPMRISTSFSTREREFHSLQVWVPYFPRVHANFARPQKVEENEGLLVAQLK